MTISSPGHFPPWRGHYAAMVLAGHGAGRPRPGRPESQSRSGRTPGSGPKGHFWGQGRRSGRLRHSRAHAAEGLKNLRMFTMAKSAKTKGQQQYCKYKLVKIEFKTELGENGKIVADLSGQRTVLCPCIANGDEFGFGRGAATETLARAD
jgi:hypothetical protein